MAPTGRDHVPNEVPQPVILIWACRVAWSFAATNAGGYIISMVGKCPREDLITTGRLPRVVG